MSADSAAAPAPREGLFARLAQLPRAFWMLNFMEMIERLAYYGVRVVIPIYIAQADEVHGLHFTQAQKGQIFMLWALVQTGVPIFSGGFADRYGYKKTIAFSIAIKVLGYVLMATQRVDRQLTEDAVVGWKAGGAQHQALIRGLLDELERELRLAK